MLLWLFRSTRVRSFRSSLSFYRPSFRSILFSPLLRIYLAFCRSAFSSLILPTFGSRSLAIHDGFNDDDGLNFCGEPRMTWWSNYHICVWPKARVGLSPELVIYLVLVMWQFREGGITCNLHHRFCFLFSDACGKANFLLAYHFV